MYCVKYIARRGVTLEARTGFRAGGAGLEVVAATERSFLLDALGLLPLALEPLRLSYLASFAPFVLAESRAKLMAAIAVLRSPESI